MYGLNSHLFLTNLMANSYGWSLKYEQINNSAKELSGCQSNHI